VRRIEHDLTSSDVRNQTPKRLADDELDPDGGGEMDNGVNLSHQFVG
jgi:hypothetical protein